MSVVDRATRGLFGGLAALRRDRALHPHGVVGRGTFRSLGAGAGKGSDLLETAGERPVLVRLSRGGGLPEPLPDVLGCALRIPDAYGPAAHQDFALASSLRPPVGRHALVPALRFDAAFYSSVLVYRIGGETRLVAASLRFADARDSDGLVGAARALEGAGAQIAVSVASPRGDWREVAHVELEAPVAPRDAGRLRFNPWNAGRGIRPAGPFQRLRDPAYRGSQAASPGAD